MHFPAKKTIPFVLVSTLVLLLRFTNLLRLYTVGEGTEGCPACAPHTHRLVSDVRDVIMVWCTRLCRADPLKL